MFGPRNSDFTPTEPAPFATLAETKAFLGISGTDDDVRLTALIGVASAAIEAYCNTVISQRTVTEYIRADDPVGTMVLRYAPVISVASVTRDEGSVSVPDLRLMLAHGMFRRADGANLDRGDYIIAYAAGYATVPAAFTQATMLFVSALRGAQARDAAVASEDVPEVGAVTYVGDVMSAAGPTGARLPVFVASLVAPFVQRFAP